MSGKEIEDKREKKRPFATGSKPGPDYLDHYLEEKGFYRKHVARDASSLFRVISEQVFDIQNYHDKVRQDCAAFMEQNIKDYANQVDRNFYNYVGNLRRSRTYGTLLELQVLARMYRRNVILFEPNQNMEATIRDFVKESQYEEKEPLRVFFSHKDKHFDTIYVMETVERLAECQAIVYDILYNGVFKLPDVNYAVERMLHDQEEKSTLPLEDNPEMYMNANGEIFKFDSHENTNCVLKDPRTCHFHNQVDFEEVVEENKDAITIINRSDDPGKLKIFKPVDGFLYKKEKSCVRQLLDENITPFPYKVAKALDSSIYRNTEFELWSENRKEQRLKWFDANGLPWKEDWGCYSESEKGRRGDCLGMSKFSYEPQIIDEETFMSLDEKLRKKYILVNPADNFNLTHLTGFDHFQPSREGLDQIVMPVQFQQRNFRNNNRRYRGGPGFQNNNYFNRHNNNRNNHNNMNYVGDIERENFHSYNPHNQDPQEQHQMYGPQQQQQGMQDMSGTFQYFQYDQTSPQSHAAVYQNPPPPQYQCIPPSPFSQPPAQVPNYQGPMVQYAYQPPPTLVPYPVQPPVNVLPTNPPRENSRDTFNLIRENELNMPVNWNARESVDSNGTDLPTNDVTTMQFFYNVGVRYYQAINAGQVTRQLENVVNQLESLDINQGTDQNSIRSDPPPVPVNTPVSTKPPGNIGSGYRYNQHNNNNNSNNNNNNNNNGYNGRRVFHNQNMQGNGQKDNKSRNQNNRKEFQFNSNVKNVHKVEQNKSGQQQQQSNANIGPTASSGQLERTSSVVTNSSAPPVTNLQISPISANTSQDVTQQNSMNSGQQESLPAITIPQQQLQAIPQPMTAPIQAQPQPQFYQPYATTPNVYPQQTQQVIYYNEQGEYLTHAIQPVYYGYQTPQTPIYYQTAQQPQQPAVMDGTLSSIDSGVLDVSNFTTAYQQPTYPYIYQPSTPMYYPQTPMLTTTPQMQQSFAPVFVQNPPAQTQVVQQDSFPLVVSNNNDTVSTAATESSPPPSN